MPNIDLFDTDLRPMQYWAVKAEDKLDQWAAGHAEGMSTGFKTIDENFNLVDGELITIAARPSMGKTIFGVQVAENVAKQIQAEGRNECVAFFSAEMTGESIAHRMAGALGGVSVHKLRKGKGSPDEYTQMKDALRKIKTLPFWMDDGSAPTTKAMFEKLGRLTDTIDVRLMLFDFLELGGDRGADTEELRIGQIIIALKDIAKALRIPVIALSQVNRDVENRANKMPTLADLRRSGQIEQVSDVVAFIMRPQYYADRGMNVEVVNAQDLNNIAYISIAKNRHGPVENVRMYFDGVQGKFGDLEITRKEFDY